MSRMSFLIIGIAQKLRRIHLSQRQLRIRAKVFANPFQRDESTELVDPLVNVREAPTVDRFGASQPDAAELEASRHHPGFLIQLAYEPSGVRYNWSRCGVQKDRRLWSLQKRVSGRQGGLSRQYQEIYRPSRREIPRDRALVRPLQEGESWGCCLCPGQIACRRGGETA